MLKTYFIEPENLEAEKFERYFFELLLNTILPDHLNPFTKNSLQEEWRTIQAFPDTQTQRNELLDVFNKGLAEILHDLSRELESLLKYFDHHLKAQLFPPTLTWAVAHNLSGKAVGVKLDYFSYPQNDLSNFIERNILNEARLSALALSIYLASILSNPTAGDYKMLFLDDIFIGLDMSNRIPLLRILRDKFADYQIFLTTYDRYWFEFAKDWFERKAADRWTFLEMYVDDSPGFEVPCLIPTKGYLKKAEDYLASHDYPACGMYLRKECERILSNLLKPAYRIKHVALDEKTKNYSTEQKNLNDMILALKDFCQEEDLAYADFEDLAIYKDALLNPLSHYDVASPIYKTELQAIMAVLEQLASIRIKELTYPQNKAFILELHNTSGERFSIEFITRDRISLIQEQARDVRLLHYCRCEQRSIDDKGTRYDARNMFASLQELYRAACQTFGVPEQDDLLSIVTLRGKSLHDMIVEQQLFDEK